MSSLHWHDWLNLEHFYIFQLIQNASFGRFVHLGRHRLGRLQRDQPGQQPRQDGRSRQRADDGLQALHGAVLLRLHGQRRKDRQLRRPLRLQRPQELARDGRLSGRDLGHQRLLPALRLPVHPLQRLHDEEHEPDGGQGDLLGQPQPRQVLHREEERGAAELQLA